MKVVFGYTIASDGKTLIINSLAGGHIAEKINLSSVGKHQLKGTGNYKENDMLTYSFKDNDQANVDYRQQITAEKQDVTNKQEVDDQTLSESGETLTDFVGDWNQVDQSGDSAMLPTKLVISDNNIQISLGETSVDRKIDQFKWFKAEKMYHLYSGEINVASISKVKHDVNGQFKTVLKYSNQGQTGWYTK